MKRRSFATLRLPVLDAIAALMVSGRELEAVRLLNHKAKRRQFLIEVARVRRWYEQNKKSNQNRRDR
jgi:hypothetical protein